MPEEQLKSMESRNDSTQTSEGQFRKLSPEEAQEVLRDLDLMMYQGVFKPEKPQE